MDRAPNVDENNDLTEESPCWNADGTCTCDRIEKTVVFTIDDSSKTYTKDDIEFFEGKWVKDLIEEQGNNKFSLDIDCNCCDEEYDEVTQPLCHYKCLSRMSIRARVKEDSGPFIYMTNYGNGRTAKYGDTLYSSETAHNVHIDGHIPGNTERRRRRLLQKVAPC